MTEPTRNQIAQEYAAALAIIHGLRASNEDLLAACKAALEWSGLDGDHLSEPTRGVLLSAIEKAERKG